MSIREDELLAGDLDYQDFKRLPREDEAVVLRTLLETFISRAWCLRQPCDGTAMLTFPSYFLRKRKEQPSHAIVPVTYSTKRWLVPECSRNYVGGWWLGHQAHHGHDEQGQEHYDGAGQRDAVRAPGWK